MGRMKILLAALLLLALISTSRLAYVVFYVAAVAGICFFWLRPRAFLRLRIDRRLSTDKIYIGQEFEVAVTASNPSWLPMGWVGIAAWKPPNLTAVGPLAAAGLLPGRGKMAMRYRLIGGVRGYYRLGDIHLTGGDPMGWTIQQAVAPDFNDGVTVYPRITPLSAVPLPHVRPFGTQLDRLRAHEDPARLAGIRGYRPGDSLRRIHWRASAARGALQVKEFTPTVTAESLILLNLAEEDYPLNALAEQVELAVEAAASLAAHLAGLDTVVGMATNGLDPGNDRDGFLVLPPQAGLAQTEEILTVLARIRESPAAERFIDLAALQGRGAPWGACLYLITPGWSRELSLLAATLKRIGKMPVPMIIGRREDWLAAASVGLPSFLVQRDRVHGGVRMGNVR